MFILLPATGRLGKEGNALVLMIFVFFLFIACTVASCNEIRYTISGKTQDARIDKVYEVSDSKDINREPHSIRVDYIIDDPTIGADSATAGNPAAARLNVGKRHETDTVSIDWFESHSDSLISEDRSTITVQYLVGSEGSSRLLGNSKRWVLIPFCLVLALVGVTAIWFVRDFNAHQRRMARQREE
jgi:hypothetical protein